MVEIRLDEEIWTQAGYANNLVPLLIGCLAQHFPPKSLLPFRPGSVSDRSDFWATSQNKGGSAKRTSLGTQSHRAFTHVEPTSFPHEGERHRNKTLDSNSGPT